MQRLEVNGAVRPIYGSLGVKGLRSILILSFETRVYASVYAYGLPKLCVPRRGEFFRRTGLSNS